MNKLPSRKTSARRVRSAFVVAIFLVISACGASKDEARNSCLTAAGLDGLEAGTEQGREFTFIEPFDTAVEGHTFFIFYAVSGPADKDYRFTVGSCHFKDGVAEYEITAQHVMISGSDSIGETTNWFRETFGPNALALLHRMTDMPDGGPERDLANVLKNITEDLRR